MLEADVKPVLPPKPERPVEGECCGSGCEPCVYDYYYEALAKWEAATAEAATAEAASAEATSVKTTGLTNKPQKD